MTLRAAWWLLALCLVARAGAAEPECPQVAGAVVTARAYAEGDTSLVDCQYVEAGDLPWPVGRLRLVRQATGRPAIYSDLCSGDETSAGEHLVHAPGRAALVKVRLHDDRDLEPWLAGAGAMVGAAQAVACPAEDAPLEVSAPPSPGPGASTVSGSEVLPPPPPQRGEELLPEAQRNPAQAKGLFALAENLYYGRNGKTKDHAAALRAYQQAARHGHGAALYSVAYMLRFGQGAGKDEAAAARWGAMAATAGNGPGAGLVGDLYYFGRGVPKSYPTSVHWYRLGVAAGHASSNYSLGFMSEHGQGVPKDMVQAARFYRVGADKGDRNAMWEYGECLRQGQGTTRSGQQAREMFQKAVAKGHVEAQVSLAQMLEKGEGGAKDLKRARQLYLQAAKAGDDTARKWLAANR